MNAKLREIAVSDIPNSTLDAAIDYKRRGWEPIPVPFKSKNPNRQGWEDERHSEDDLSKIFTVMPKNVGVLMGKPSNGLVDIDLDCVAAAKLAQYLLPVTGAVFGRPSNKRSHYLYTADPLPKTKKYRDPLMGKGEKSTILELRSTGAQTIMPPSVRDKDQHCPQDEPISWDTEGEATPIDGDVLESAVSRLAAGSLLVRYYPAIGARHEASLALAGALCRAGWPEDDIRHFIVSIARCAGDEEAGARAANVATTALRATQGETVIGWPTLAKLIGKDIVNKVREWLGTGNDEQGEADQKAAGAAKNTEAKTTKAEHRSQATQLVELVLASGVELFHTRQDEAYARIHADGHYQHWPLKSKAFRSYVARLFYTRTGMTPGSQAVQDALSVLAGQATYAGEEHAVDVRLARHGDAIYIDLANDKWQSVKVTATGWELVDDPPVRFRRARGMLSLPTPERGGHVRELRKFVNMKHGSDDEWALLVAVLVSYLQPDVPSPILAVAGEPGAAKTTLARLVRLVVDPNSAPIRAAPKSEHDLMVAAANSWVVAYDNLSYLPAWLSDALCRLCTGGGFAVRELYSDAEETIFDARRPVVVTAIGDLFTRSDVLDRAVIVTLEQITEEARLPERDFWENFNQVRARVLAGLLDAVSCAMRNLPTVRLEGLPRMADFAMWAVAAEPALGLEKGSFLRAYTGNRAEVHGLALESTPIASVLQEFMEKFKGDECKHTAASLLAALNEQEGYTDEGKRRPPDGWPKRANRLSALLRELAPDFRVAGLDIQFVRSGSKGRTITIRKIPRHTDTTDTPTPEAAQGSDNGRRNGDDGDGKSAGGDDVSGTSDAGDGTSQYSSPDPVYNNQTYEPEQPFKCPVKGGWCADCAKPCAGAVPHIVTTEGRSRDEEEGEEEGDEEGEEEGESGDESPLETHDDIPQRPPASGGYLAWFDDDEQKPATQRIQEGAARYREKYGLAPTVVLVNKRDADVCVDGLTLEVAARVQPKHYHLGRR